MKLKKTNNAGISNPYLFLFSLSVIGRGKLDSGNQITNPKAMVSIN